IFLETMADTRKIEDSLLEPLKQANKNMKIKDIITNVDLIINDNLNDVTTNLLEGSCALLIEDNKNIYTINVRFLSTRDPNEPTIERAVRGSHQGFIEDLDKNLNIIRHRIENKHLKF